MIEFIGLITFLLLGSIWLTVFLTNRAKRRVDAIWEAMPAHQKVLYRLFGDQPQ